MKYIDITKFNRFKIYADEYIKNHKIPNVYPQGSNWGTTCKPYHIVMQIQGMKSADIADPGKGYMMDDRDYNIFVLKYYE